VEISYWHTATGEYGKIARSGLLLHSGSAVEWIAPKLLAAPWWPVV
jgi:hypothetical protein